MSSRQLQVVLDLDSAGYKSGMGAAGTATKEFGATVKTAGSNVQQLGSHIGNTDQITSGSLQHLRDYVITIAGIESIVSSLGHTIVGTMEQAINMSALLERQTMLMRGLSQAPTESGKLAEANKDMADLFELSKKSGYGVDTLANAFVRLKSTGMDPMQGSLQSMVDAVAAFGGGTNEMNHVALALQEMADKGTLSMKELRRQFAIFVPDGMRTMAEVLGLTMDEMTKKISAGAVAAKPAMELMLRQLGIAHAGAAERMAQTLQGQLNTFHTGMIQMAGDFTGQLEAARIEAERQAAIESGDTNKLKELDEQEKHAKSLYATIKQIMSEINTGMQGAEGRNAFRTLGEDIAVVVREIANVARFLIQYRQEVLAVGEVITFVFATKLITAWGTTMLQMLAQAAQSARALFATEAETIPTATQLRMQNNLAILDGVRANQALLDSTREIMAVEAEEAAQQEEYARLRAEEASQDLRSAETQVQALQTKQVALEGVVAKQELAEQSALRQLQTGRSVTGQYINQTAALTEYQAAVSRLATAETMLARTDAELLAAESRVTTALEAKSAAMGIATTATENASLATARFEAAEAAATAELTIFDTAAAAATLAVDALSTAVKFALGPWGILIGIVLTAAQAMGVFKTKADEAAAAADRAKHHMADEADYATLTTQGADLQSQADNLQRSIAARKAAIAKSGSDGSYGAGMSIADEEKSLAGIKQSLDANRRARNTLITDHWQGVASDAAAAADKGVTVLTERMYQADAQLRANIAKITDPDQRQKQSQKLDMLEQGRVAGFQRDAVKGLEAQRAAMHNNTEAANQMDAALGGVRQKYDQTTSASLQLELAHAGNANGAKKAAGELNKLGMASAEAQAKSKGLGVELAKVNYEIAHGMGGFKNMTPEQIAQARGSAMAIDAVHAAMKSAGEEKSFDKTIETAAGRLAELKSKLADGGLTKELDKFNAELKANPDAFKNLNPAKLAEYKKVLEGIDATNQDIAVKGFGDKLHKDLDKATQEADGLWASFENGGLKVQSAGDKLRAQLIAQLDTFKTATKGEIEDFTKTIDQIVGKTDEAAAARLADQWNREADKTLASLGDNKKRDREADFNVENHLRQQELAAYRGSVQGKQALDEAYFHWRASQRKKLEREDESALTTQMRQWSDLASNLQQAYASIAGSFVDMLSSGKFDVKAFVVDILKELAKVILEAMIAYAILSAIGMTPTGQGGQKLSFTQFLGQGITNSFKHHEGGIIGQPTNMSGSYPASLWDNAPKYHGGGMIDTLGPNEVPIIGLKGERVLTEDQQKQIAAQQGTMQAPPVTVNVVNNGNDQMTPDVSTHFNGKEMIVNVVLEAASKQGPLRDALQGLGGTKK